MADITLTVDGIDISTPVRFEIPPHGYVTVVKPSWEPQIGPHDCECCREDLGDGYEDFNYCPYCGAEL